MNRKPCVQFFISKFVLAICSLASCASVCLSGQDFTLYDVDFNGPPHVVGATPAFAAGAYPRNTPTSGGEIFSTGSAKVVAFNGPMNNRPARLTAIDGTPSDPTHLGGADLHFDLTDPQLSNVDVFHASVDVLASDLRTSSGLGIFFDASTIHSVQFLPNGTIRIRDATGVDLLVGQYSPETIYTVQMTFDRSIAQWSAAINGIPVYHGPTDEIDMETFRIAMTTGDPNISCSMFVDNIKVSAVVPEPSTLCLAGTVLLATTLFARRRRTRQA